MKEIKVDTGLVTYSINEKCEITFNPTDTSFVEKLFNTLNAVEALQKEYETQAEAVRDNAEIFEFARAKDKEMRSLIDNSLGAPVCDAVFGDVNVHALAKGLPLWCNLLFALIDEVGAGYMREKKAMNPRVEEYLKKYRKYDKYKK